MAAYEGEASQSEDAGNAETVWARWRGSDQGTSSLVTLAFLTAPCRAPPHLPGVSHSCS